MKQTLKLGKYVREVRKSKRMTLQDVAGRSGLTKGIISRIENGTGNPCLSTLTALGRGLELHVSFGELLC